MNRAWIGALAIDAAAVLMFATAGRNSHDDGSSLGDILVVAAPFLVGLVAGWAVVQAVLSATTGGRGEPGPLDWRAAFGVWTGTLLVGMVLRRTAWDRGTALSFVVVSALVLGGLLFGWRALWSVTGRRGTVRSAAPPSRADR